MSSLNPQCLTRNDSADYRTINEKGFLKISGLIPEADVKELSEHMDCVLRGEASAPGFPRIEPSMSEAERLAAFSRIHNAHRVHPLHERFLLHPRILDVLEQLTGPDILALQSMSFFKQPGQPGQGYHQDSYYIPTLPNTLIAAWVAVSEATEENGCLWFRVGSQCEPVYPQVDNEYTHQSRNLDGIFDNSTASIEDVETNQLASVAIRYQEESCPAKPGDVVFFRGNILHRSFENKGATPRRALWDISVMQGALSHARGDTQLAFAKPRFGTPCAALEERKPRIAGSLVAMPMGSKSGMVIQQVDVTQRDND
ncbi:hypothetical protein AYO22_01914 [Fonsecaea multimorphosa]|nr:hypothetical protein AYO22_01914 [Fonsecaea multimorphosa]